MTNRKIKFNFVDFLIFLIIAAAAALVVFVFAGSFGKEGENKSSEGQPATIEYVVEIKFLDNNLATDIAVGMEVENSVSRKSFGELMAISRTDTTQVGFDYTTGQESYSVVEGKSNLLLTIRAQAEETEDAFSVNDFEIRVGTQLGIHFPGFVCSGYCIGVTKLS